MAKKLETLTLNFDDPTVEETEEHQRMAESIELVKCYSREIERNARRAKIKNPRNYDELLKACRVSGVNIERPSSEDIITMRRQLINIMKYTKLNANCGEKVLTYDAKPERVIEVYKGCIETAKKIQLR